MKFEVYCDENHPELFTSKQPTVRYMLIGSLWIPSELRNEVKSKIWDLRKQHETWGEIKWSKVSRSKLNFYSALIDLFQGYGDQMRFRCIAIDHTEFDKQWHDDDNELGFYKFYYQLLHHWILDFNEYSIFCDTKTNRDLTRLSELNKCLNNANISSKINQVQALPSRQVVLIQLCDFLLGMASSRLNDTLKDGGPKKQLLERLERQLGIEKLQPTYRSERKFNIFKIDLRGGW